MRQKRRMVMMAAGLLCISAILAGCAKAQVQAQETAKEQMPVTLYLTRHGKTMLNTTGRMQGWCDSPLTEEGAAVAEKLGAGLKKAGITFDAVYTGYLASAEQCSQVCSFFDRFYDGNNLILVDPAMADNGSLYPAFDESFPAEMAKVCAKADIILPNITEACLLTGTPYKTSYDESYIHELLKKLLALGCHTAALTGVSYEKGRLGVVSLDRNGDTFSYFTRHCPQSYHGTGDLYSSTVLGGLMRGLSLGNALSLAADFVVACIEATASAENARWYAVEFESQIPLLCEMLDQRLKNN